jgi:hypothetical protein
MILAAPTNSFAVARERLGPHDQQGLAISQLTTYPRETLWDDGELVLYPQPAG